MWSYYLHIRPEFLTDNVLGLVKTIREDFDSNKELLPILADALEEIGCTEKRSLEHLRSIHSDSVKHCAIVNQLYGRIVIDPTELLKIIGVPNTK